MPANIEVFQDGSAGFVSGNNIVAWHRLGQVVEGALTSEEALRLSHLADWNVRLVDLQATVLGEDGVSTIPVANNFATVRTNPVTKQPNVLGVVGNRYEPIQNETAFRVLDDISDLGGASFETAGSLGNGERVFVTQRLDHQILVGGEDAVDTFLLATTSHDGSTNLTIAATPVRVVCQNTLSLALRTAKRVHKVRHTKNAEHRVQEARQALQISFAYLEEFEAEANALIDTSFTESEFQAFLESLIPAPEEQGRSQTIALNARAAIKSTYFDAPTQQGIKNTAWGAYNAVVEYVDFLAPVRGGSDKDERRAERVLTGQADALKQRAWELVSA